MVISDDYDFSLLSTSLTVCIVHDLQLKLLLLPDSDTMGI